MTLRLNAVSLVRIPEKQSKQKVIRMAASNVMQTDTSSIFSREAKKAAIAVLDCSVTQGVMSKTNMSEEYGPNFVTLTDEEGNDIELEYIDALEHNGTTYMAFFPVVEEGEEENEDEYGLIILKSETVDGEEMLANVVDEDEINDVN